jgi:hypothetical protein
LFDEKERYAIAAACRWIDLVVEDAPYSLQLEIIDRYGVDLVVHGDDFAAVRAYHDYPSYTQQNPKPDFRTYLELIVTPKQNPEKCIGNVNGRMGYLQLP